VYAFVKADESVQLRHKTECHVCEHPLVFQANVEVSSCCHNIYEGAVKDEQCH
jgi:ribosomal protein L31